MKFYNVITTNFVFVVGLDDSKSSGNRKSFPVTVEDSRIYIDHFAKNRSHV